LCLSIQDKWVYCDDISLDYTFAQSVLFKVYGSVVQETGHKTRGHACLTDDDKDNAKNNKGSLLYGELLPRGANKVRVRDEVAALVVRFCTQVTAVKIEIMLGTISLIYYLAVTPWCLQNKRY
jgi:hypothetical protein